MVMMSVMGCRGDRSAGLDVLEPQIWIFDDFSPPYNIVGRDVPFHVPVNVFPYEGNASVKVVDAVYNGHVLASTSRIQDPELGFKYTNLFIPFDGVSEGEGNLIVRARSFGGIAEEQIHVRVDNAEVNRLAREYIRKYWEKDGQGRYMRLTSRRVYYVVYPLADVFAKMVRRAFDEYLTPWTGLTFVETQTEDREPIIVVKEVEDDSRGILYGSPRYRCDINIWGTYYSSQSMKVYLDILLVFSLRCIGLDFVKDHDDKSIMYGWGGKYLRLHPYQMKAIRMVYSKPFGAEF